MMPDDNAPTVPNRLAQLPNQPPLGTPRQSGGGGNQPVWQVPQVTGQVGAAGASRAGFGLGFGIALAVLAIMALVLAIALNVNGGKSGALGAVSTNTPTVTPTQNPTQPTATALPAITNQAATTFVTQFYINISSQAFQNAYGMLGNNLQSGQSLDAFKQQWQGVQSLTVDTTSFVVSPAGDGSSNVTVKVNYSLTQNMNGSTTSSQNSATLTVGYEQGNLHILALNVTSVQATPTPVIVPTDTPTTTPTDTPTPTATPTDTPTPAPTTPTP